MIIEHKNITYVIDRDDYVRANSRNVLIAFPWEEAVTGYGDYVNVKIADKDVKAIESVSGNVYIKNAYLEEMH